MIFCQNNLITSANATITGGSTNFPIANLIDDRANTSCQMNDKIVIDLGTATLINTLAIKNANTSITIEANATDAWGAPSFTQSMTLVNSTDISLKLISETYRFWRISASSSTFISHAYIGNRLVFPDPLYGSTPKRNNTDIVNSSPSGQRYITHGVIIKDQDFSIRAATDAQYATLKTFQESSYRSSAGIFSQTETNFNLFDPYFAIVDLEEETHERPGRHAYSLEVQEAK